VEGFTILVFAQISHGLLHEYSYLAWSSLLAAVAWAFDKAEDIWPQKIEPCTQDILCGRLHRRHKTGCPGHTVKVEKYVRGLLNA
jgi:hypothetical protein